MLLISFLFLTWSIHAAIYKWRSETDVTVEIPSGISVNSIAMLLHYERVIKAPKIFAAFAAVRGYGGKLKAGEYSFPKGMILNEVLKKIVRGEVIEHQFRIIEGWSVNEIAKYLSGHPVTKDTPITSEFKRLCGDKDFIKTLGIGELTSLEGYLFPDTYKFSRPFDAVEMIQKFVSGFKDIYSKDFTRATVELGMAQNQVIALASIVEKETGKEDERPIIASVFLNRLKKHMALQSDPTVIYGLPDFDGNLKKEDLSNRHEYNTYVHAGLPPGPICNPGRASIEAVLFPAKTDYLYFVSKNDGSHEFSRTLAEHNRAVTYYQR